MVARAAGYGDLAAYLLAYYSQIPDEVGDFAAIDTIKAIAKANNGMSAAFLTAWAQDVNQILHSLHGGNPDQVRQRRECLLKLLKQGGRDGNADGLDAVQRGLLIHALGDAYGHTKADGSQYGWPTGHFKLTQLLTGMGHAQDHIATNPQLYRDYVLSLYASMSQAPAASNARLQALLASISQFDHNEAKSLQLMQTLASNAGYNQSFVPGSGLDPTLHTPTHKEVQDLIDYIRKNCMCGK